jgi:hypothetical protein
MTKVKKMAFGGIGRALKKAVKPAAKPPVGGPMGSAIKSATPALKFVDPIMNKSAAPTRIGPSGGLSGALKSGNIPTPATNAGGIGPMNPTGDIKTLTGGIGPLNAMAKGNPTTPMGSGPSRAAMMKKGGTVSSASKRADGCAIKGKTRGKMV